MPVCLLAIPKNLMLRQDKFSLFMNVVILTTFLLNSVFKL